ncbi:MAG: ABC transporter ATP-binding protein/permease [Chroococcidiopsidaceae cyanobacterium CP_BM_ER_R8_30]|nr:ABC transporter ATP-binding protein/permease [Chroococcidiopsidaceae cyanobacterium CP_BM_ER_R8_30]
MNRFDRQLWNRFWAIAKPYWFSEEKWGARGLLLLLVLFSLSVNGLNVIISFVGRDFMTALASKEVSRFFHAFFIYIGVFVVGTPIVVLYSYVGSKLSLYWRRWLTNYFLKQYFSNRAFYEINSNPRIDNPDERIAQDIAAFTDANNGAIAYFTNILDSITSLISFIGILWSISTNLVIVTVVYSFVGTVITVLFGRRLIGLNFNQLRREADFRYKLVHIRNHAEMIAFFGGEEQESRQAWQRFMRAFDNFNFLIGWQRNLGFFTTGYSYFNNIIPPLVIAPLYFAGKVQFGVITQASMAFSSVIGALSLIVSQFQGLSAFIAEINRLSTFAEELKAPVQAYLPPEATFIDTTVNSQANSHLALEHVTLLTPDYRRVLIRDASVTIQPGSSLLILGPSGSGKSSLLRAMAGLWNAGTGLIIRPELEQMLFLPQRPYMILGSLRSQLLYPNTEVEISESQLYRVLQLVNLVDLPERVGGLDIDLDWANVLSLGEQQRLAFARLLLTHPRYAILDEATSALDLENESRLYQQMQATSTVFISVGHRTSLLQYHQQILELKGDSSWRLLSTQEYTLKGQPE